ncbi:MAG: ABC transporter permease [Elusimicrobiota bacterium]
MKKILKNKMCFFGLAIVLFFFILAFFGSYLTRHSYTEHNLDRRLEAPSSEHIMGTDDLGRDIFARVVEGSRISLSVGFVSVGIALLIGVPLGLLAGFYGKWIDRLIMRAVDIMLCFPSIFLILMVIAFLGPSIYNVMIVIGLTSWPGLARYVRGETLSVRRREYILAAQMMGISKIRILFIHILPNTIAPVIISAALGVGSAILSESILSFLGLGVQPPDPSWGNILTLGKDYISHNTWWLLVFPGAAILLTVVSFNMIGEGLRDVLDPRHRSKNER